MKGPLYIGTTKISPLSSFRPIELSFLIIYINFIINSLIGGFHVTSYQAKFAGHHIRDRHVTVSCSHVTVLGKATKCFIYFLFQCIPHYQITTDQEYQHTHSDEIANPSMNEVKLTHTKNKLSKTKTKTKLN